MLRTRILSQGDEILTGVTLDTNARWLAEELTARGAQVVGTASAPDDLEAIARLVAEACADADLVVSTGGLGPTDDDLTNEAVARAAGVAAALDERALAQVEARFRAFARPMGPANRKQAVLPLGCEVLENRAGTAPGFALEIGRARAFFFPGVPRELYVMAEEHLFPWLKSRGLAPLVRRRFHFCGVGESVLQDRLRDLALAPGVKLGFKTWLPYNTVVLYADPAAGGAAVLDAAAADVRARVGADAFGEDAETLPAALGRALGARGRAIGRANGARGLTVALAESCTAGLASAMITETPGSSAWFRGGVVAYADGVKRALLGVPNEVLAGDGAVSEACARAMAEGVRGAAGADLGLSITGIAGPGGGSDEKPVGLVCFGLALAGAETVTRAVRFGDRGRDVVRTLAAATALEWLRRRLAEG